MGRAGATWIAAGVAFLSLTAAIGAAFGPAHANQATIRWPARAAGDAGDRAAGPGSGESSFTPLLLSAHSPESLRATVPCAAVARSTATTLVFATTRGDDLGARLAIEAEARALRVRVGGEVLVSTAPIEAEAECDFVFTVLARGFGHADWSLARGSTTVASGTTVPPVVSGFRSDVDPRGSTLHVSVTARAASSSPSTRQWLLVAIALLGTVLALVVVPGRPRRSGAWRVDSGERTTHRGLDAIVLGSLVAWWLLGPWFFDDGWLMATVRAREGSGSFSNYFDTLGAQMPLGFVHHVLLWPFAAADAPFLVWRVVPLIACASTWLLIRRVFVRALRGPAEMPGLAALAAAHLLFSFAWLLTLRPEPVVALLSAIVFSASLRYRSDARARTLGFAGIAAVLAMTLHPSGLVAAAPLLAAAPAAWRVVRRSVATAVQVGSMVACATTVAIVALFADTDVARWRVDRGLFAGDGFHSRGVRDELDRYRDLLANGSIPALASVLVAGIALLAWAVGAGLGRRRGSGPATPEVFGLVLLAAVALLTLTPSKWTYHFGSVSAVATLAIAAESARVASSRDRRGAISCTAIVLLLALAGARSFLHPRDAQCFLELGTPHLELLGNPWLWTGAAAVLLAATCTRAWIRRWSFVATMGAVISATFVLHGLSPLVAGPPWSVSRAGLDDLVHGGCPIARSIEVSDLRDAVPLAMSTAPSGSPQWYSLDGVGDGDVVVTVRAPSGTTGMTLRVAWARRDGDATGVWSATTIAVPPFTSSVYAPAPPSRPVRVARRGSRPAGANALRVTVDRDTAGPLGSVTDAVVVAPRTLESVLAGRIALVSPPELPLLRCTNPPIVRDGIAAMPDVIIGFERRGAVDEIPELGSASGPWFLAEDAYPTARLWAWLTDRDAFAVTIRDTRVGERSLPIDVVHR